MPSAYEPPEPAEVAVETQTLASKTQFRQSALPEARPAWTPKSVYERPLTVRLAAQLPENRQPSNSHTQKLGETIGMEPSGLPPVTTPKQLLTTQSRKTLREEAISPPATTAGPP